jgi:hypothetical protein
MRMMRKTALAAGAGMSLAFLAACSDAPVAPAAPRVAPPAPSFAVGDAATSVPVPGKLIVCKEGNIGGDFTISRTSGSGAFDSDVTLDTGDCVVVAEDNSPAGSGSVFRVHEVGQANTTFVISGQAIEIGFPATDLVGPTDNQDFFINSIHGIRVTYTNTNTPPPSTCDFSTFGGFVLDNNYNISYGGNAGRVDGGNAYGSLNFVNHDTGDHIHVWNVTDYGHPDSGPLSQYEDSRLAFGLGSINGGDVNVPVEFRFLDSGEPAKKLGDMVYLKVGDTVLIDVQNVDGGNIQLHSKCKKAPTAEKH